MTLSEHLFAFVMIFQKCSRIKSLNCFEIKMKGLLKIDIKYVIEEHLKNREEKVQTLIIVVGENVCYELDLWKKSYSLPSNGYAIFVDSNEKTLTLLLKEESIFLTNPSIKQTIDNISENTQEGILITEERLKSIDKSFISNTFNIERVAKVESH